MELGQIQNGKSKGLVLVQPAFATLVVRHATQTQWQCLFLLAEVEPDVYHTSTVCFYHSSNDRIFNALLDGAMTIVLCLNFLWTITMNVCV